MGLSRTVSEIDGDFDRKSPISPTLSVFNPPTEGFPWNWVTVLWLKKKLD